MIVSRRMTYTQDAYSNLDIRDIVIQVKDIWNPGALNMWLVLGADYKIMMTQDDMRAIIAKMQKAIHDAENY